MHSILLKIPYFASFCLIWLHSTTFCLILPHLASLCLILPHFASLCLKMPHNAPLRVTSCFISMYLLASFALPAFGLQTLADLAS